MLIKSRASQNFGARNFSNTFNYNSPAGWAR